VALKTASESVRELVFKNMSERAAVMLREDMEAMAAVKLSEVENTQFEIVQIARKLEEEGKIIIASGGDSAYV
jgi:flagellar motor switch protein FliG